MYKFGNIVFSAGIINNTVTTVRHLLLNGAQGAIWTMYEDIYSTDRFRQSQIRNYIMKNQVRVILMN